MNGDRRLKRECITTIQQVYYPLDGTQCTHIHAAKKSDNAIKTILHCAHLVSLAVLLHRFFWSILFTVEKTLSEDAIKAGIPRY